VYIEGELTNFFSILDMSFKFFNEIKWLVLTQKKIDYVNFAGRQVLLRGCLLRLGVI